MRPFRIAVLLPIVLVLVAAPAAQGQVSSSQAGFGVGGWSGAAPPRRMNSLLEPHEARLRGLGGVGEGRLGVFVAATSVAGGGGVSDWMLALTGVAGATVGTLGGGYLGYRLDDGYFNWDCENGCEDPGIYGFLGGWFAGSALVTPLAVHLANEGRGSLGRAYAVAAAAGMAGLLSVGSPDGVFFLLGVPLAQVVSAVLIERATSP